MNIRELITIAMEAALLAGKEILAVYHSDDFEISLKSDQSPLTRADKAAHEVILERLEQTHLPVLSEEGNHSPFSVRSQWEWFWLVDPLDGTKEFIHKTDEFTVNIALIQGQKPMAGVIYVPVSNTMYYSDDTGAYIVKNFNMEENHPQKLPLTSSRDKYIVAGSRSHMTAQTLEYIQSLETGNKEIEITPIGSSLKICLVAEGKADIYPRLGPTMEWDTAAGHAIALASGKNITVYPENTPLLYNKENLLNPYFVVQ